MSTRPVIHALLSLSIPATLAIAPVAHAYDAELRAASDASRKNRDLYRFRTHVDAAEGAAPGALTAEVSFTPLDGGPDVPSIALEAGIAARAVYRTTVDLDTFAEASLEFQIPEKVVMDKEDDFFSLVVGGGWVDTVDPSGLKARARLSGDGTLDMIVFNENRDWNAAELAGIDIVVGEQITSMDYVETRQRWVAPLAWGDEGPPLGRTYRASVSLLDASGTPLDTLTDTFVIDRDNTDPGIEKLRVGATRKGDLRMVSWTSSDGPGVTALEMSVVDGETGEALITTTDDAPVYTEVQATAELVFEGSPAGWTYPITATPLALDGTAAGPALFLDLVVGEYDAESTTVDFAESEDGSVGFALTPAEASGTWTMHGRWDDATGDGKKPSTWVVSFMEPFEGPVPQASQVKLAVDRTWSKWVQRADVPLTEGADAQVFTTLTTAKGEVIDVVEASGTDAIFRATENVDNVDVFIQELAGGGDTTIARRIKMRRRRARI